MRQDDRVDTSEFKLARLEGDRRGGSTIDHQGRRSGLQPEAGVEAAAGAEGIAATNDRQAHRQAPALGRLATSACQRRTLAQPSGTASLAGFMKSMATMPVMSAT